jgi:hypothetical protein
VDISIRQHSRKNTLREEMLNSLNTFGLGAQMLILLTLVGCSARIPLAERERTGCELDLNAVCAHAINRYTTAEETMPSTQRESPNAAHLVPLVVSIALMGRDRQADVDCYISMEYQGPWLVYAHEIVLPRSSKVLGALREQWGSQERLWTRQGCLGRAINTATFQRTKLAVRVRVFIGLFPNTTCSSSSTK